MIESRQRTLARPVSCSGVGVHTGRRARLTLSPAAADAGLAFVRRDLGVEIPARAAFVVDTTLCVALGTGDARVGTVEHVLAALAGMGVDNCRIEVDGPEVPVLDGSAAPFVELVREAGLAPQAAPRRLLAVRRPVEVRDGDRLARLEPARELSLRFTVDFDHPLAAAQTYEAAGLERTFARELAPARTFCFLRDVGRLRAAGLALGGSLENALVLDEAAVVNPGGLRFPDELARHKALDALGDLALLGAPLVGRFVAHKSGHALNHALVRRALEEDALDARPPSRERAPRGVFDAA